MSQPAERIGAYLDRELPAEARTAFEAEMAADPVLAAAVERHRALAARLAAAYAPVLDEPVPARLAFAARTANDAGRPVGGAWRWTALAASLAAGVLVGRFGLAPAQVQVGRDIPAKAQLAVALESRLAADPGVVRIGVTFQDAAGRFCRTFESPADGLAGLACRDPSGWRLVTATDWRPSAQPAYRAAASETPPAVLAATDQMIDGQALDAAQERAARDRGWRRQP